MLLLYVVQFPLARQCKQDCELKIEKKKNAQLLLQNFAKDGLVNLVGGCCGTTPAHIKYVLMIKNEFFSLYEIIGNYRYLNS